MPIKYDLIAGSAEHDKIKKKFESTDVIVSQYKHSGK